MRRVNAETKQVLPHVVMVNGKVLSPSITYPWQCIRTSRPT